MAKASLAFLPIEVTFMILNHLDEDSTTSLRVVAPQLCAAIYSRFSARFVHLNRFLSIQDARRLIGIARTPYLGSMVRSITIDIDQVGSYSDSSLVSDSSDSPRFSKLTKRFKEHDSLLRRKTWRIAAGYGEAFRHLRQYGNSLSIKIISRNCSRAADQEFPCDFMWSTIGSSIFDNILTTILSSGCLLNSLSFQNMAPSNPKMCKAIVSAMKLAPGNMDLEFTWTSAQDANVCNHHPLTHSLSDSDEELGVKYTHTSSTLEMHAVEYGKRVTSEYLNISVEPMADLLSPILIPPFKKLVLRSTSISGRAFARFLRWHAVELTHLTLDNVDIQCDGSLPDLLDLINTRLSLTSLTLRTMWSEELGRMLDEVAPCAFEGREQTFQGVEDLLELLR